MSNALDTYRAVMATEPPAATTPFEIARRRLRRCLEPAGLERP
jgi:hypothetical protein